jgi:predicted transcriptional regulator
MSRRPKGALESEVLAALAAADHPLTAGEVVAALEGELAYTTVQTILSRLLKKGAVQREQLGRAHAYSAALDGTGILARHMHDQLAKSGDRASVLSHFFKELTPEDEATLSRLLDDQRRAGD